MRAACACLLALLALAPAPLGAQATTRLLGRVVNLSGEPVRDVRLRIVGHGEPEVFDSGEFQLELAGTPTQVEVAVVAGGLEVLYPLGGQLTVPRDPGARVAVVVGKPERAYINDVLAARFVQLENTLRQNGVRYDASADSLSEGVQRIISLLELKESDLRSSIEQQKRQNEAKPELLRTVDTYLLELKDLKDAFRLVVSLAPENRQAVAALQDAAVQYNAAYTALNNNRNVFQSNIRSLWEGARAEGLERDLADVYTEAIEGIHQAHVLPLNNALITLQLIHSNKPPGKQQVADAVAAARQAVQQLEPRINVLDVRYARLREALDRN